jgi:hypothetical protein
MTSTVFYKSFSPLREALAGLLLRDVVLDGEIVCMDDEAGASSTSCSDVRANLCSAHSICSGSMVKT